MFNSLNSGYNNSLILGYNNLLNLVYNYSLIFGYNTSPFIPTSNIIIRTQTGISYS